MENKKELTITGINREQWRKYISFNLGGHARHEDECDHKRQSFNGAFWSCKDCGKRMKDGK